MKVLIFIVFLAINANFAIGTHPKLDVPAKIPFKKEEIIKKQDEFTKWLNWLQKEEHKKKLAEAYRKLFSEIDSLDIE